MALKNKRKKSVVVYGYQRFLPWIFISLSLLIMILPLQGAVNSTRALLSFIFIPQIRAAHSITQYLGGVNETMASLLNVAHENVILKADIADLKVQNARLETLEKENERLADILRLNKQLKWKGIWSKVAYREPSRHSTVIIDKGAESGIELRAAVIGVQQGTVGLVGKVIENSSSAAKVLLSSDEEFSAAAFLSESGFEGLCTGNGKGGLIVKYLPLDGEVKKDEKVFTSASSAIFPDGILIGTVESVYDNGEIGSTPTYKIALIKPAFDTAKVKEVFVLPSVK